MTAYRSKSRCASCYAFSSQKDLGESKAFLRWYLLIRCREDLMYYHTQHSNPFVHTTHDLHYIGTRSLINPITTQGI